MSNLVREYITQHKDRMLEELSEYLAQPSFAETGEGIHEGANMTRSILEARGAEVEILEAGGHPVVLGVFEGSSDRTLLLYQHYDVLPPGDEEQWESPPFNATVRNGHLYARGTADHKGSFMSRVHAIDALLDQGPLPLTVIFLVEGEEEIGSPNLGAFLQKHQQQLRADAALYSGWWHDEANRPRINCGMSGAFSVRISVKTANYGLHGRLAPLVPNAAWTLAWVLAKLKNQDEHVLVPGFYEDVDELTEADRAALRGIPFDRKALTERLGITKLLDDGTEEDAVRRQVFEPALTISAINVGDGSVANIPCTAEATLRVRMVPSQRPRDIVDKILKYIDSLGFEGVTAEVVSPLGEPARINLDEPIVQVVQQAAAGVYGREVITVPVSAGSGPRYLFVNKLGVPMIADPGVGYDGQRDHGFNENIRLQDYYDGVEVMANIMTLFPKIQE